MQVYKSNRWFESQSSKIKTLSLKCSPYHMTVAALKSLSLDRSIFISLILDLKRGGGKKHLFFKIVWRDRSEDKATMGEESLWLTPLLQQKEPSAAAVEEIIPENRCLSIIFPLLISFSNFPHLIWNLWDLCLFSGVTQMKEGLIHHSYGMNDSTLEISKDKKGPPFLFSTSSISSPKYWFLLFPLWIRWKDYLGGGNKSRKWFIFSI